MSINSSKSIGAGLETSAISDSVDKAFFLTNSSGDSRDSFNLFMSERVDSSAKKCFELLAIF